jgi:hypothetical protein
MRALALSISLLVSVFMNTQEGNHTNDSVLVFTDTEHVYIDEEGRHYKNTRTYDWPVKEKSFFEEYFMVLVFIGLLALFGLYQFLKKKDQKEEVEAEENYVSKYFGEINKTNTEEFYETETDLYERKIELTIHAVSERHINHESIERIEDYIDHLVINETKINRIIQEDYRQNGEAKKYINLYLENPENKGFVDSIKAGETITQEEQLLSSLYLLRISFYPEKRDKVFAVLDYTINEGPANAILVVIILKDNKINITTEH